MNRATKVSAKVQALISKYGAACRRLQDLIHDDSPHWLLRDEKIEANERYETAKAELEKEILRLENKVRKLESEKADAIGLTVPRCTQR